MTPTAGRKGFRRAARLAGIVLFIAVLLVSRTYRLADKPLHHDESLFGYYSYFFAAYGVYNYDPILHGPFLIEATGAIFRFLGDNDFTLRLVSLIASLLLFPLLLPLRTWLGRSGTLMAFLLLLVSPNLCYYSRYQREDVLFLMITMINLAAIAGALKSERAWPLVLWPVSLAWLVCVKENVVFFAASQIGFAALWVACDAPRIARRPAPDLAPPPKPGDRAVHLLTVINVNLLAWCVVAWLYALYIRPLVSLGWWAALVWLAGVAATAFLTEAIWRAVRDNRDRQGLVFRLYERLYCDRYWCIAGVALAVALLCFCYSIALTQPKPVLSLLERAVAYWWGEHATERLGGAFHCYAPQIMLYEMPALGIIVAALVRDWLRNGRARRLEIGLWLAAAAVLLAASDWWDKKFLGPWSFAHLRSPMEFFWAATIAYWGVLWTVRSIRHGHRVRGWFLFWLSTSYLFYGYAGEKVPWLALHIMLPLWLTAAVFWNDWNEAGPNRLRRGLVAGLVGALLAWNAWQTVALCFLHPTNPAEIAIYNHTREQTQRFASTLVDWIETGKVSGPSRVVVSGEATWPLVWYLRRYPDVRFEDKGYRPSRADEAVVTDVGEEDAVPVLRQDFQGERFELRSAWVPPAIDLKAILCLRTLDDEPAAAGARLPFRLHNSLAILGALGEYVLLRQPFSSLPPPPDDQPFGTVYCTLWVRRRLTPEPLLPPPE